MASAEITAYATSVASSIRSAYGSAVDAKLAALSQAASTLAARADAPQSATDWQSAVAAWSAARNALGAELRTYLVDGLPDIPGLGALAAATGWDSIEGLHGELDLGPLRLSLASGSLSARPPPVGGQELPSVVVGPYQPLGISASLASPFGSSGANGGGTVMRLADRSGFGGALQLPLGVVSVDATAVLQRLPDGAPSFIAILGLAFTPPIQLSFGFSLDRVGGVVGVHRTADADALSRAIRSGAAGNVLFAAGPPGRPAALIEDLRQLFPPFANRHVVGPTLRLAWLSLGAGSLLALDVGVIVEIPTAKIVLAGIARAQIPGAPGLMQLRLDVLGVIDAAQQLTSIDASLVDSHVLGVFSVYGDAGMRLSWGSQAYAVVSVGGFFPGFNPEPARLPPLRRVGLATNLPVPGLRLRAEGYFAVTTNTIQLGARLDATISLGLVAHGFLQVDALVQFSPFYFVAQCAAGFDVSAGGFKFCGVRLDGAISGPGPLAIRGRLTIETFLFDISWDESFSIGSGPAHTLGTPPRLLDVVANELNAGNLRAQTMQDAAVVLEPRTTRPAFAAVPPTGTLEWRQRRAPLGLPIDRVDGQPLGSPQGVSVTTAGTPLTDSFSPGSYCTLTSAEALNRPPFDTLMSGIAIAPSAAPLAPNVPDDRTVEVILILGGQQASRTSGRDGLAWLAELVASSHRAPALSDATPMISASREQWSTVSSVGATTTGYASATAAHQFARQQRATALAAADADAAVDLVGV